MRTARRRDVSTSRAAAFAVVRRVFESGAYADRALAAEAAGLESRDRALATRIAYGAVQRRLTLDHIAAGLVHRPLADLEPAVLAALRVGLFQLLYLDGVAPHAAVDETVELVKRSSRGGAGLVNAVLRRAAQHRAELVAGLHDEDPAGASVMHSLPRWLAELWWDELGGDQARALMRQINEPAEAALRVNTLVSGVVEVAAALPVPFNSASEIPEGLVLEGPFDAQGSALWGHGAIMPQSRASMLVARMLAPEPGSRVLDLCAAPGGKTTHLAALIEDRELVVAVERHPGRARALERMCARMHASCARVLVDDARHPRLEQFDRVLVDPPCSGLGTLQSRPDRRWRASREAIEALADLQLQILAAGAAATSPGGALVYSVCTISSAESEAVIVRFLREHPEFEADDLLAEHPQWVHPRGTARHLQLLPHRDGTDGFFIARLRRAR
jgi:16S rRNA (cytosine967-C5)-methyltransferase